MPPSAAPQPMEPVDVAKNAHQLPGVAALHGAMEVLLGFLPFPKQGDDKASSSWRLELPPPSHVEPRVQLSKQGSLAQSPTAGVDWGLMSGTWIKDKKASTSMEPVLQLMHMRGLVRQAVKLVKGVTIKHNDDVVTIEVFSYIGWFKIVERYNLDGTPAHFKRRDLRRGQHTGQVRVWAPPQARIPRAPRIRSRPDDEHEQPGTWTLDLTWEDPHGGGSWDVYELKTPDLMYVHSTVAVGKESLKMTSVFRRK